MTGIKNTCRRNAIFAFIMVVVLLISCPGLAADYLSGSTPKAENGILDLSDVDFQKIDSIRLDGFWQFFWQQLLTPKDFSPARARETECILVPQSWTRHKDSAGTRLNSFGFATYRLQVILPKTGHPLALSIFYMSTAYRIWIDGRPVPGNGIVSSHPDKATPQSLSQIIPFAPGHNTCDIIIQVSNFSHTDAGIVRSITLGREARIRRHQAFANGITLLVIGSILAMGGYHFLLFCFRPENLSHLFFCLICLLISLRNLTTDATLITQVFPDFSWQVLRKIMILCLYLLLPVFSGFLASVFPRVFSKQFFRLAVILGLFYTIPVFFLPVKAFWPFTFSFKVITLGFGIYTVIKLIHAAIHHQKGTGFVLFGFTVFFASVVNEILYSDEIIQTGSYLSSGLLILILSQALVLAIQHSRHYNRIEALVTVFKTFVPSRFLDHIAKKGIESIAIGNAENDTIAVLFCDIRSFTPLSEKMKPDQLLCFLNSFFSAMSEPIHKNHGFIDKFLGDAIMALFDSNGKDLDHTARNALKAAVGMHQTLAQFNKQAKDTHQPELDMGIGIHIGNVVIGTVGTSDRMDSTVLGDAVNIASRLESLTKGKNEQIIVSSEVVDLLKDPEEFALHRRGHVLVKGKTAPVLIYGVWAGAGRSLPPSGQQI